MGDMIPIWFDMYQKFRNQTTLLNATLKVSIIEVLKHYEKVIVD
jgi:hypothetical protein